MKIIQVSATEARNSFFTLLNKVVYGNAYVVITKAGADCDAILTARTPKVVSRAQRLKLVEESFGALKHAPRSAFSDKRLRGSAGKAFLNSLRNA